MKTVARCLIASIVCFLFCSSHSLHAQPVKEPGAIFKDFGSYWEYHRKYVLLNRDFTALDQNKNAISKDLFFDSVIHNNLIPLRLRPAKDNIYQLYPVPESVAGDIGRTIKEMASEDYDNFKREGKTFPPFHFEDLTGNRYDNTNTKDKILVLKCWFTHCVACVAEFPALNKLFKKYEDNKGIMFLSLAFDDKNKLADFLVTHPLAFNSVADQKYFLTDVLSIKNYPTHLIIKDGVIIKSVNTVDDLEEELNRLAAK